MRLTTASKMTLSHLQRIAIQIGGH